MNKRARGWRRAAVVALAALGCGAAAAQQWGETVTFTGVVDDDIYAAGRRVSVLGEVNGDAVLAGAQVELERRVTGDVLAMGGDIEVRGDVGDDLRAAGGTVTVAGGVGGDALLAGGTVTLTPSARVAGRAWLAGGDIEVAGHVGRELKAAGGTVVLAGEIGGDAELMAEHVKLLPTARIAGNLTYRSPQPAEIADGAQVGGRIVHQPLQRHEAAGAGAGFAAGVLFVLSLLVVGAAYHLVAPGWSLGAARTVGSDFWKCLGLGLVVLLVTPFVIVALFATLLGMLLALIVLAIYLVSLLLGYLTGVLYLADAGLRRGGRATNARRGVYILALLLALIVLAVLRLVPVAGGLISFLVLLLGLGALQLRGYRTYRSGGLPEAGAGG